jgi:hypothetical protein
LQRWKNNQGDRAKLGNFSSAFYKSASPAKTDVTPAPTRPICKFGELLVELDTPLPRCESTSQNIEFNSGFLLPNVPRKGRPDPGAPFFISPPAQSHAFIKQRTPNRRIIQHGHAFLDRSIRRILL